MVEVDVKECGGRQVLGFSLSSFVVGSSSVGEVGLCVVDVVVGACVVLDVVEAVVVGVGLPCESALNGSQIGVSSIMRMSSLILVSRPEILKNST